MFQMSQNFGMFPCQKTFSFDLRKTTIGQNVLRKSGTGSGAIEKKKYLIGGCRGVSPRKKQLIGGCRGVSPRKKIVNRGVPGGGPPQIKKIIMWGESVWLNVYSTSGGSQLSCSQKKNTTGVSLSLRKVY